VLDIIRSHTMPLQLCTRDGLVKQSSGIDETLAAT
jgi:hypothetical protein